LKRDASSLHVASDLNDSLLRNIYVFDGDFVLHLLFGGGIVFIASVFFILRSWLRVRRQMSVVSLQA